MLGLALLGLTPQNVTLGRDLSRRYLATAAFVREKKTWAMGRAAAYLETWVRNNEDGYPHCDALWDLSWLFLAAPPMQCVAGTAVVWSDFAPLEGAQLWVGAAPRPVAPNSAGRRARPGTWPPARSWGGSAHASFPRLPVPDAARANAALVMPGEEALQGDRGPGVTSGRRSQVARPPAKRARLLPPPAGVVLVCSKCRHRPSGCTRCRQQAGV